VRIHVSLLVTGLLAGAVPLTYQVAASAQSAVPIERFVKVDDRLYRGAQPDEEGFKRLKELGVRTVINLRQEADAARLNERQIVESLGMQYESLPILDQNFFTRARRIPEDTIRTFFRMLDTADPGPVFVHCQRGADRTGALIAFYRMARNGWNGERAAKEAREVGMRSWYTGLQKQILEFSPVALTGS
jgi:protein tyrosine/serine phosphatase